MTYPMISIIIPVYNCEKYIIECLDSLINQTFTNFEIICVDDGSNDDTHNILLNYTEKDSRIKMVFQEHKNAGAARNLGFSYANGKYVLFLDADDFYEADMLEKLYSVAVETESDITVCRSDAYVDDTGEFKKQNWAIRENKNIFLKYVGWAWDKLIDTSLINEYNIRFQEIRSSNDMAFIFTILLLCKKITIIDDELVHHRVNNINSISQTTDLSWDCFYLALKQLKENLIHYDLYQKYRRDYIDYSVHFSLWHLRRLNDVNRKKAVDLLMNEGLDYLELRDKKTKYFYNQNEYKSLYKILYPESVSNNKLILKYEGIVKSLNENGLIYTIKRILFHLHLAKDNDPLRTMEKKDE